MSISSNIFKFLLSIYWWYIFNLEWKWHTIVRFFTRLNSIQPTIKFGLKYSKSSTEFLDAKKLQKQREKQITNDNKSETNRSEELFDPTSAHPKLLINSIPFSKALRLKMICSEPSQLSKNFEEFNESFINRVY